MGMPVGPKKSFHIWRALLRVGWMAVLLGLTMEAILVALAAGFGNLHGAKPIVADVVQKVSWSLVVCVGLAVGATAEKARPIRQFRANARLDCKETVGRAGSASRDGIGGWNNLRDRTARVANPSRGAAAPLPALISGAANEFLFPVGCAFVIYISKVMRLRVNAE